MGVVFIVQKSRGVNGLRIYKERAWGAPRVAVTDIVMTDMVMTDRLTLTKIDHYNAHHLCGSETSIRCQIFAHWVFQCLLGQNLTRDTSSRL